MDMLKKAKHLAGKEIALWKVFLPLMLLSGLFMLSVYVCGVIDITSQYATALFYFAGGAQLLAFFGSLVAYFIARKDPKLVRKQLEITKEEEEVTILYLEKSLAKYREMIDQNATTIERTFHELYTQGFTGQKESFLRLHKARLVELRHMEQRATPRDRVLHQDFYLRLARVISDAETSLELFENKPIPELSREIVMNAIRNVNTEVWAEVGEEVVSLKNQLIEARENLAAIERLLQA